MRSAHFRRVVMFVCGGALVFALMSFKALFLAPADDMRPCAMLKNALTSYHFSAGLPWPQVCAAAAKGRAPGGPALCRAMIAHTEEDTKRVPVVPVAKRANGRSEDNTTEQNSDTAA